MIECSIYHYISIKTKINDIQNLVKYDRMPKMPSAPSPLHPCSYCEILGHGKVEFSSENLLERHGVHKHPGWPIYIQNQT